MVACRRLLHGCGGRREAQQCCCGNHAFRDREHQNPSLGSTHGGEVNCCFVGSVDETCQAMDTSSITVPRTVSGALSARPTRHSSRRTYLGWHLPLHDDRDRFSAHRQPFWCTLLWHVLESMASRFHYRDAAVGIALWSLPPRPVHGSSREVRRFLVLNLCIARTLTCLLSSTTTSSMRACAGAGGRCV